MKNRIPAGTRVTYVCQTSEFRQRRIDREDWMSEQLRQRQECEE